MSSNLDAGLPPPPDLVDDDGERDFPAGLLVVQEDERKQIAKLFIYEPFSATWHFLAPQDSVRGSSIIRSTCDTFFRSLVHTTEPDLLTSMIRHYHDDLREYGPTFCAICGVTADDGPRLPSAKKEKRLQYRYVPAPQLPGAPGVSHVWDFDGLQEPVLRGRDIALAGEIGDRAFIAITEESDVHLQRSAFTLEMRLLEASVIA